MRARRRVSLSIVIVASGALAASCSGLDTSGLGADVLGDAGLDDAPIFDHDDGASGDLGADVVADDASPSDAGAGDVQEPGDGAAVDAAPETGPCGAATCTLGCNTALARCNRPWPTNLAAPPPESALVGDVEIGKSVSVDVSNGNAYDLATGAPVSGLGFSFTTVSQPGPNPKIALFTAGSLKIPAGVQLRFFDSSGAVGNAPMIVVAGDVEVSGTINVSAFGSTTSAIPGASQLAGPGGFAGSTSPSAPGGGPMGCGGGSGVNKNYDDGGGGGGGSAAAGGRGSHGTLATGGAPGAALPMTTTPLRGGCGGGFGSSGSEGGGGGGALEISAGGTITLDAGAQLLALGNGGVAGPETGAGGGGGGGGVILLEASSVVVHTGAFVATNGGGGGAGGNGSGLGAGTSGQPGQAAIVAANGGASNSSGGKGGFRDSTVGADAPYAVSVNGGGGGGAVGGFYVISPSISITSANHSSAYQPSTPTKTY